MAVQLIVRIAPWTPANIRRSRRLTRLWLALGALVAVLLLLIGFGCTAGGGPPAAATQGGSQGGTQSNGTTTNSLVEANGGGQASGDGSLVNQGILGADVTLNASRSADGTLLNQNGLLPPFSGQ